MDARAPVCPVCVLIRGIELFRTTLHGRGGRRIMEPQLRRGTKALSGRARRYGFGRPVRAQAPVYYSTHPRIRTPPGTSEADEGLSNSCGLLTSWNLCHKIIAMNTKQTKRGR